MKYLIGIVISLLNLSPASAVEPDALALLKRDLGNMIEFKSQTETWYCPDNTCDMYKIVKAHPDFISFIYLHLYHESDYIYLNESIGGFKAFRNAALEEPKVRQKMDHYCPSKPQSPKCILENMKHNLGITVGFGRYDEGYFCYGYTEENICKKL